MSRVYALIAVSLMTAPVYGQATGSEPAQVEMHQMYNEVMRVAMKAAMEAFNAHGRDYKLAGGLRVCKDTKRADALIPTKDELADAVTETVASSSPMPTPEQFGAIVAAVQVAAYFYASGWERGIAMTPEEVRPDMCAAIKNVVDEIEKKERLEATFKE